MALVFLVLQKMGGTTPLIGPPLTNPPDCSQLASQDELTKRVERQEKRLSQQDNLIVDQQATISELQNQLKAQNRSGHLA